MEFTDLSSGSRPDDSLGLWLTPERIALSELMSILFEGLQDGTWTQDEGAELAAAALTGFGNGCCYYLASVVAQQTGRSILGFFRPDRSTLLHAAVFDPETGDAFDILGRRSAGELKSEIEGAVGHFHMANMPLIPDMDPDEVEILTIIAGGLPWMGLDLEPEPRAEWGRLVIGYVRVRGLYRSKAWP